VRVLRWSLLSVAALVLLVVAAVLWVTATRPGTGWLLGIVSDRFLPALSIEATEGTLAGRLRVRNLVYAPADSATRIEVAEATVELGLLDLATGTVHVESATLDGIDAVLGPSAEDTPQAPEQQGSPLDPPIDIVVEVFALRDAVVRNAEAEQDLVTIHEAQFAGSWTSAGIEIERLDVDAADGVVHLTGSVTSGESFAVDSQGRFEWLIGQSTYAGRLEIGTHAGTTTAAVNLTAPFPASLQASAKIAPTLEWQLALDVPEFDPRDSLLPAGQFESLAASLSGSGTAHSAALAGRMMLDGEPLVIESLDVEQRTEVIAIEQLVLQIGDGPGELTASGTIATGADPLNADLDLSWHALELPERWVGQRLHTRGQLDVNGSIESFAVRGDLAAGPSAERLTRIDVAVDGSTRRLQIERLDVVQDSGRFAASGSVDLEPQLTWDLQANATSFDPGELLAAWEGDLELDLATQGQLTDAGPRAEIQLTSLDGTLRGRPISGQADLTVSPPNLAGDLRVQSGDSTLAVEGQPGDELDANVQVEVASLNDWLPDAGGSIRGQFHLGGTWQSLELAGQATAREVDFAGARVGNAVLNVDLAALREPTGSARLRATDLDVGGFSFAEVVARLDSASPTRHQLDVTADGERLDVGLAVVADREAQGWSGSIGELTLDLVDFEPLRLTDDVRFETATGEALLEELCLAGASDIRICASLGVGPGQATQVKYQLDALPLRLVSVFAPELLPGELEGFVSGSGELARSAAGRLTGDATLSSAAAELNFLPEDGGADREAGESLLLYEDLELSLQLAGHRATANLSGALGGEGSLAGEMSLAGVGEARTTLNGNLDARLPTLAPIAPFIPQVTELAGQLQGQLEVAGTLAAPQLGGRLTASELTAGIPDLGLHLKNGAFELTPRSAGGFAIDGSIESGDGALAFDGVLDLDSATRITIEGENFLAADLPAGEVVITPDLLLEQGDERISLTGEVLIASADINVKKLPQGRPQQASPDVVVIDAQVKEEESEVLPLPLYAQIQVVFGEEVAISAYGLEAELDGSVVVTEQPNRATLASGTITVDGSYQAYGQDLTIADGQLLFAGTPIDNPQLNIIAKRELEEVTAGLRIGGTARNPEISLFSDPALGDADALSYLVAGRPLAAIGTGGDGDADALESATRSLGGAAGGVLAEAVGKRLGIDEASVEESEMLGGSAFTLGEYLSPRLYLGYGVGLFEPGEVITLRYLLSDDWSVEAVQGPEETRAGIKYEVER